MGEERKNTLVARCKQRLVNSFGTTMKENLFLKNKLTFARTFATIILFLFSFSAGYGNEIWSLEGFQGEEKIEMPQQQQQQQQQQGLRAARQEHRVVVYSLYGGDNPRYIQGALANANLMPEVYPGWEMRVYHDKSIPQTALDYLRSRHVVLKSMDSSPLKNPMEWRFLVASDPTVDRYVMRDVDGRLSQREKSAVDEWIAAGTRFHVMRDHPSHSNFPMSGGMWGGMHNAVPDMEARLLRRGNSDQYLNDMNFLGDEIWPLAQTSLAQHDSFSCESFGGGRPFPTPRIGYEHVGSVYIDGKMRPGDVAILKERGVVAKCTPTMNLVPSQNLPVFCFPHASGTTPQRQGQILGTFASVLTAVAASTDVHRIIEIGTWYGGGSTQALVDGLRHKAHCASNATHHCCEAFVTTFEVFEPAWEHSRLYHQNNPVSLVLGTTVGLDQMLTPEEIPESEKLEHYRLYYERDKEIMKTNTPQLAKYCRLLSPHAVLIDGNEYTGWGEFQVVINECRPRYLALQGTGTLKTRKVEAHIRSLPELFIEVDSGVDNGAGWAVFRVAYNRETQDH